jgi:hypothetical protein
MIKDVMIISATCDGRCVAPISRRTQNALAMISQHTESAMAVGTAP